MSSLVSVAIRGGALARVGRSSSRLHPTSMPYQRTPLPLRTPLSPTTLSPISSSKCFSTAAAAPAAQEPSPEHTRKQAIQTALSTFSFEVTPTSAKKLFQDRGADADAVLQKIAVSSKKPFVYVTKLPDGSQQDTIDTANLIKENGLTPIPHIPARGMKNADDLDQFLHKLDCQHVLIVGGSLDTPVGEFSESLDLLKTGILQKHAIKTVGLASHPQGADNIDPAVLDKAFVDKLAWARSVRGEFEEVYWCLCCNKVKCLSG